VILKVKKFLMDFMDGLLGGRLSLIGDGMEIFRDFLLKIRRGNDPCQNYIPKIMRDEEIRET